jgi:hypothetical protein
VHVSGTVPGSEQELYLINLAAERPVPGREVWRVVVSASRSVAVLGPIPRDRIITHRGEVFEKYGCALYTVAAFI